MTRRSFLGTMLALAAAPAIVRAESIMRIVPRRVFVPMSYYVSNALLERMPGGFALSVIKPVDDFQIDYNMVELDVVQTYPNGWKRVRGVVSRNGEIVPPSVAEATMLVKEALPGDRDPSNPGVVVKANRLTFSKSGLGVYNE